MFAILSFLLVLILSLLIVRIGAVLLKLTGMSYDVARFQARSAFTGTGFSTSESEMIMGHPLRRRIVSMLMLSGPVGFISFSSSLVLSFLGVDSSATDAIPLYLRIIILTVGVFLVYLLSISKIIDKILQKIITRAATRWTSLNIKDYESLLNISGEYNIIQYQIQEDSWIENESLETLRITDEGILIVGIKRFDGYYVGTPHRETILYCNDEVLLYGKEANIRSLISRTKGKEGDLEHLKAIEQHKMMTNRKVSKED